ncbi:MAG: histidine phosphatase family protein [Ilumatobacteraceae bacterium]|nr:histidine phosphatase family protein [Acidimicrobiia bacterium]NCZ68154.1 histidine phosphatase family protein [Acidimicrobiia bacterium]NDF23949.1 histidine phosphatase family protein [Actinomycetota bacterium]
MGESASDRGNAPSDTGNATSTTAGAPKVLMVRHGESEWNVLGKWQGRADIALTEAGREQARAAADYVRTTALPVTRVLASTLRRAHETAEIIAERLGLAAVMTDERLVETDVGPWEGLRADEIEAGWPRYLRDRKTPPGFEPPDQVFARATQAIREAALVGEHTLIVSHSGVIRTIRRIMTVHDRRLHNLEGCTFSLDESGQLRAHDFVTLVANTRDTVNDSV